MQPYDVLIVGAGPTGLVLALWLTRFGVRVRIVDRTAGPGSTSRALAVQARTLELYRQLDLTDAVIEQGHRVPALNLWVQGRAEARIALDTLAGGLTPYGPLTFSQDRHERLLESRLQAAGVVIERNTELLHYAQIGGRVMAQLRGPGGEEPCEAAYVAGCDGARSLVRQILGMDFPGGTYQQLFYVADVEATGPVADGELHINLDQADFLAVFPLDGRGRVRLIGTVRDERAQHPDELRFDDVSERAIGHLKLQVRKVNWFSTYRVHHRVTDHFRQGRAFLLGDAAHIHSPAGGQGMNTGIGDAINLAWKLAAVIHGRAAEPLLDSYETERIGFARTLVATTDRVFTLATAEGTMADLIRTRVVPVVAPAAFHFSAIREYLFSAVSQIALNYRSSPISLGQAGRVHGGDRLPWAPVAGMDNFDTLKEIGWQAHVYGTADTQLADWCRGRGIPLHVFAWHDEHEAAGFCRDALYLLRPDSYVAFADPAQDVAPMERHLQHCGLFTPPA